MKPAGPGLIGERLGGENHKRIFLGAGDGGFRACMIFGARRISAAGMPKSSAPALPSIKPRLHELYVGN